MSEDILRKIDQKAAIANLLEAKRMQSLKRGWHCTKIHRVFHPKNGSGYTYKPIYSVYFFKRKGRRNFDSELYIKNKIMGEKLAETLNAAKALPSTY